MKIFADDTKLYYSTVSLFNHSILEIDLENVLEFLLERQLPVALDKSAVLHLGRLNPCVGYAIGSSDLVPVDSIKDLGVTVSRNLDFCEHYSAIVGKASRVCNLIFRVFSSKDPMFLIKLFNVYARPILEYSSCVWSPSKIKDVSFIESVQRRFTKRIPFISSWSYKRRLEFLAQDTLELRRLRFDMVQVYKILNNLDIASIGFKFRVDTRTRGHSRMLLLPPAKTAVRDNFFALRVVRVWNSLPDSVVTAPSLVRFKVKLAEINLDSYLRCTFD